MEVNVIATTEAAPSATEGPTLETTAAPMGSLEGSSFVATPTRVCSSTAPSAGPVAEMKYCVRYEGNHSKRWDGQVITLDGEWLESLYDAVELVPGKQLILPRQAKGGGAMEGYADLRRD